MSRGLRGLDIDRVYVDEFEFDGYFMWLCDLVNADMDRYSELLYCLHEIDFVWILDRDESRAGDGLDLRKEYYYFAISIGDDADWIMFLEKDCSVLEALIGLARRINFQLEDVDTGDATRVYFWDMVKNLGLKKFDNYAFCATPESSSDCRYGIENSCRIWMNREFDAYGNGGVFPLREASEDQREVTFIYQMFSYIVENYICE